MFEKDVRVCKLTSF